MSPLPYQDHLAIGREPQNRNSAGVFDNLAHTQFAGWQPNVIDPHVDEIAIEPALALQRLLVRQFGSI